jgi:hypothetical protein
VPLRNWEPLVNVHARLCCLAHAGIEVSSHDPLWNYTNILSSVDLFLETIPVLFVKVIKQHLSSPLDKKGIPFSCVVSFPWLWWWLHTYKFPLHPLCKGEALELFSVEKQLISSQNGDWFSPAAEMQEFVHSLSYLVHAFPNQVSSPRMKKWMNNLNKWISTQMHDLFSSKCELSTFGLPMVLRGPAQCHR